MGGFTGARVTCTEEYNGTSWAAGGAMITARNSLGGAGTQNAGLAFGGYDGSVARTCTEEYNGTSWSAKAAMITARRNPGGAGITSCALAMGGDVPAGQCSCTEEFTAATVFAFNKTFDYSSSSGAVILSAVSASLNFADDTEAATGGIPLGGLYRSGSLIRIRLS